MINIILIITLTVLSFFFAIRLLCFYTDSILYSFFFIVSFVYAKLSIPLVLQILTVAFLSYLVRQFLFIIGIINNFNKD